MEYKHVTYGFAGIELPDGGVMFVHFNGTIEEAQRQINKAADKYGGVAPDLSSNKHQARSKHSARLNAKACRIFNEGFDA